MVEVKQGKRTRIVTSCLYPVAEGIEVQTQSDRVGHVRKIVLQLQMARCPESQMLGTWPPKWASSPSRDSRRTRTSHLHSLPHVRPDLRKGRRGLRDRVFLSRNRKDRLHPVPGGFGFCIGCGACAYVCPTGHIEMEARNRDARTIWGRDFKMKACKVCGDYFAPMTS